MNQTNTSKKENPLLSILLSIVIPAVILSKFSKPEYLGVLPGFLIALAFPIGLALYNMIVRKEFGFIAILGFVSIFLTGIIGVFQFPPQWIAVKEALVPLLIGIAVVVSLYTPYPLIRKLIYNDTLLNLPFIEQRLAAGNRQADFERAMKNATWIVALSFLVSAVLNYTVAKPVRPCSTSSWANSRPSATRSLPCHRPWSWYWLWCICCAASNNSRVSANWMSSCPKNLKKNRNDLEH